GEGGEARVAARLSPKMPSPQDAQHPRETPATDAGQDEGFGPADLLGADLRRCGEARARPDREIQGPVSGGDGVPRAGPGGVRHLFALSRGASPADQDDQSPRTLERRKPPAYKSDSAVSDGALVSVVAVCEFDHGVEALAWNSHGRPGPEAVAAASRRGRPGERGRCRLNGWRKIPTPSSFTGMRT